jgi:hypothetical protein
MVYKYFCFQEYIFFSKIFMSYNKKLFFLLDISKFKKFIYFESQLFNKMAMKSHENWVGAWLFLTGVVLAVLIGVAVTFFIPLSKISAYSSPIYAILVILGIIIGVKINVSGKDSQTFLISSAVLVIVSRFGMESVTGSLIGIGIGDLVSSVFGALLVLFVPATIIVALKNLFSITNV